MEYYDRLPEIIDNEKTEIIKNRLYPAISKFTNKVIEKGEAGLADEEALRQLHLSKKTTHKFVHDIRSKLGKDSILREEERWKINLDNNEGLCADRHRRLISRVKPYGE